MTSAGPLRTASARSNRAARSARRPEPAGRSASIARTLWKLPARGPRRRPRRRSGPSGTTSWITPSESMIPPASRSSSGLDRGDRPARGDLVEDEVLQLCHHAHGSPPVLRRGTCEALRRPGSAGCRRGTRRAAEPCSSASRSRQKRISSRSPQVPSTTTTALTSSSPSTGRGPDHDDVADRGMDGQHVLDLHRVDLVAADVDQPLAPAGQEQPPGLVDAPAVAGEESAAGERLAVDDALTPAYPRVMASLRMVISPWRPGSTGAPSASRTASSTPPAACRRRPPWPADPGPR